MKQLSAQERHAVALRSRSLARLLFQAILPVALIAAAVFGFVQLKASKPPAAHRKAVERVWPIDVVRVAYATHRPILTKYGEVVAGRKVTLRALVAGKVARVGKGLREGGVVKKGQMLLAIDRFEYELARNEAKAILEENQAKLAETQARLALETSALARAREQLEIALKDRARTKTLVERRAVSAKTLEDRDLLVSQRRQAIELRQNNRAIQTARLDQQKAINTRLELALNRAMRNLTDTDLRAPFDAYVSNVTAQAGRYLTRNDTVAELNDVAGLEVRFSIADAEFARINQSGTPVIGSKLAVRWHGGGVIIERAGIVERVGAAISADTGGVEVFARLYDDGANTVFRPGAFVEISLPDRSYPGSVRLPETALYGGTLVYVAVDGRLEARTVTVVGANGGDLFVTGDFTTGDAVMTTRLSQAGVGVKVEAR
ncbi:MAG: efflux RND transporter periplasmic adaptor subunit [Alphaproteobacteria bacterium]